MNRIVVTVFRSIDDKKVFNCLEFFEKKLLQKLKLATYWRAVAFQTHLSSDRVDLEVRLDELKKLHGISLEGLEDGDYIAAVAKKIDQFQADIINVQVETKLQKDFKKDIAEAGSDLELKIEIEGEFHSLLVPEKLLFTSSDSLKNTGIFIIDGITHRAKKCVLRSAKTSKKIEATMDCDKQTKKRMIQAYSEDKLVKLSGPSVMLGDEVQLGYFSVGECHTELTHEEFADLCFNERVGSFESFGEIVK
jgi:hypothetical protein